MQRSSELRKSWTTDSALTFNLDDLAHSADAELNIANNVHTPIVR